MVSEQGNSGQAGLRYPLALAPNAAGFVPALALQYSSQDTNARTDPSAPASDEGEGWSLPMAFIRMISTQTTSAAYSLTDLGNISDLLIPSSQAGFYQTEHLSHLPIQRVTSSQTGNPCFQVYDRSGTFYEFGCTPDALLSSCSSPSGWNLDRVVAPHQGPSSLAPYIAYRYVQDQITGSCTSNLITVRDAGIAQISYGTQNAAGQPQSIAGTVDFFYRAPFTLSPWATAYGTNYNCSSPPPTSTTLRCDDPTPSLSVMNTLSLQTVTSYVGDDSSPSHQAYQYQLSYQDSPYYTCVDPLAQISGLCAGEHLLSSIRPLVVQNGVAHPEKPVTLGYTQQADHYTDSVQTYSLWTTWSYLSSEQDTKSGAGERISYLEAHANSDGTGYVTDSQGNIIDDRHDPFFCTLHANQGCTALDGLGSPDDLAWSEQAVTQITAWGSDSSALAASTTSYHYRLASFGTYPHSGESFLCYPAGNPPYLPGQTDCPFESWSPLNPGGGVPTSEYRGFAVVYTTTAAGDLVVDNYDSTEGWGTPQTDAVN